jgi:hypothetical protein
MYDRQSEMKEILLWRNVSHPCVQIFECCKFQSVNTQISGSTFTIAEMLSGLCIAFKSYMLGSVLHALNGVLPEFTEAN